MRALTAIRKIEQDIAAIILINGAKTVALCTINNIPAGIASTTNINAISKSNIIILLNVSMIIMSPLF